MNDEGRVQRFSSLRLIASRRTEHPGSRTAGHSGAHIELLVCQSAWIISMGVVRLYANPELYVGGQQGSASSRHLLFGGFFAAVAVASFFFP